MILVSVIQIFFSKFVNDNVKDFKIFTLIVLDDTANGIKDEEELLSEYNQQSLMDAYLIDPLNHILIFLLYFFEYIVITSFFDRITQLRGSDESNIYLERNLYTVSQFLYQFGVLAARSSMYWFKSKATGLIAVIMFVLFVIYFGFWIYFINVHRIVLLILALLTGIFGGWGYLFSYYRVMDNKKVTKENREKLINYLALSADFGSFIATAFATLLSTTLLKIE